MTKTAKKISKQFIEYTEISFPFMWDSILKDEKEDIQSTLEALIDSEIEFGYLKVPTPAEAVLSGVEFSDF